MGRTIKFDNKDIYTVTGILEGVPANTDFPLKVIVSYLSLKNVDLTDWQGTYGRAYTFVRLPPGLIAGRFNILLRDFGNRHTAAGIERRGIVLQPLAEMHSDTMRSGAINSTLIIPGRRRIFRLILNGRMPISSRRIIRC